MEIIKLETNLTWSKPTQYMIAHGAKLSLHKKELIINDNTQLTISLKSKDYWLMNDNTQEELKSGGTSIDIPIDLRAEFINAIKKLDTG